MGCASISTAQIIIGFSGVSMRSQARSTADIGIG
jgi:hypothetical protein